MADVIALQELGRLAAKTEFGSMKLKDEQVEFACDGGSDEHESIRGHRRRRTRIAAINTGNPVAGPVAGFGRALTGFENLSVQELPSEPAESGPFPPEKEKATACAVAFGIAGFRSNPLRSGHAA